MIRFIAAFSGLLALHISLEQDIVSPKNAVFLGYLLGYSIGFFK